MTRLDDLEDKAFPDGGSPLGWCKKSDILEMFKGDELDDALYEMGFNNISDVPENYAFVSDDVPPFFVGTSKALDHLARDTSDENEANFYRELAIEIDRVNGK